MEPEVDSQFREIARERTGRHPLRTYLKIPFLRSLAIWFTPRVELLPVIGACVAIARGMGGGPGRLTRDARAGDDECVLSGTGALGSVAGAGSARVGAARCVYSGAHDFLFGICGGAEPRYVLECFPAIIALAAQLFARVRENQLSSTGSG